MLNSKFITGAKLRAPSGGNLPTIQYIYTLVRVLAILTFSALQDHSPTVRKCLSLFLMANSRTLTMACTVYTWLSMHIILYIEFNTTLAPILCEYSHQYTGVHSEYSQVLMSLLSISTVTVLCHEHIVHFEPSQHGKELLLNYSVHNTYSVMLTGSVL